MFTTKKQEAMQHHGQFDNLVGAILSIVSLAFVWLGRVNLNIEDVAAFMAVLSAGASIIINFPKLKKRLIEIYRNAIRAVKNIFSKRKK